MSATPASSFDVLSGADGDPLLSAAALATTRAIEDPGHGILVVVIRPTDDAKVVSGGGTGVLRAAVSVAVAAGNDRLWRDAPHGHTASQPVTVLPEVITASAGAAGVHTAHIGCVRDGDRIDAVAIWFETWRGVANENERQRVLTELEHGALIAAERRAAAAAAAPQIAPTSTEPAERTWDRDDPRIDALTGVLTEEAFVESFDEFEGDEATLLMLDIDAFHEVAHDFGDEVADRVLAEVADRIVDELGAGDRIGRIDHDRFAVLLTDAERSEVMLIAKRLAAAVSAPLPDGFGPAALTATTALAHQAGLVDLEEMYDSAAAAVASGKRSGGGKFVLAA